MSNPVLERLRPARLAARTGAAPTTSYGLSPRLTRKARERLGNMALALAAASVPGMFMAPTLPRVMGGSTAVAIWVAVFNALGVVVGLALWKLTRTDRFEDSTVLDLGLLWEVGGCLAFNLNFFWFFTNVKDFVPPATPVILWIVLQPVLVPSPLRRTVLTALAAAATAPVALGLLMLGGWSDVGFQSAIDVLSMPLIAAGLGIYASRVVHRLAADAATAEQMGSYTLESRLGAGGMGEVWRATHGLLARPAAVKLIRPDMLGPGAIQDPETALARFEHEARTTARLRSPHTVEIFDFGQADDGRFYYVMELLDGVDLRTLVDRYGPQPPARVVQILRQACHSLDEAHAAGLVHRDIKPANLFLCHYGRDHDFVKVLDFGLVRGSGAGTGDASLTQVGSTVGTPAFMAPEMGSGRTIDGRADLYALGCVGYLLLTGQLVFEASTPVEAVVRHARDEPEAPSLRTPEPLPGQLDAIILSCLSKEPEQRPADARELSRRLAAVPLAPWDEDQAALWWETHQPNSGEHDPVAPSHDQLAPTMPIPGLSTR